MSTPRDGDRMSDHQKKGYSTGFDGTVRSPWGHAISGWHGPVRTDGTTIRDQPRG